MRHGGGFYIEPEHARLDFLDTWGRYGHSGGESTQSQPGFIPYSLHLEPVLEGRLSPVNLQDVDNTMVHHDERVAEVISDTVAESPCIILQPSPLLRRPSRQAVDVPYNTMVSFSKEIAFSCRKYFLTRVGEESAYVYLAVLLLRKIFDSVQRRWVP
jgi:hypothetical protein